MYKRNNAPPTPIPDELVDQLTAAAAAQGRDCSILNECIVCGATAKYVSIFIPTEAISQQLGAPKGKIRMVPYGSCESCFKNPNLPTQAEEIILSDFAHDMQQQKGGV